MRLLNIYTLQLDEFFGNDIPPYFILSHRWEGEEITYKDFVKGRRQDSPGYKKILAFCEYAKVLSRTEFVEAWMRKYGNVDQELDCTVEVLGPAGLWSKTRSWYNKAGQVMDPQGPVQWIWVDTCCIDKRSSAELSEAINSMFAWYAGALACVAYLSDVHVPHMEDIPDDHTQGTEGIPDDDVQDDMDGIPDKDTKDTGSTSDYGIYKALKKSLWFTRGWTLQELLAPPLVIFCDSQWNVLGYLNKPTFHAEHPEVQRAHAYHLQPTLEGEISRITNIDVDYLADDPEDEGALTIGVASVAERMSWAAMRETTRIEDTAYCLWGDRAFIRLQEEIVRTSNDKSIFAWNTQILPFVDYSAFASSPYNFSNLLVGKTGKDYREGPPYAMTNRGLYLRSRTFKLSAIEYQTRFPVDEKEPIEHDVFLVPLSSDTFPRPMMALTESSHPNAIQGDYIRLPMPELWDGDRYLLTREEPEMAFYVQPY